MSFGGPELLVEDRAPERLVRPGVVGRDRRAARRWQLFWRRFRADRVAMVSLVFIVVLIIVAIFARPIVSLLGAGPQPKRARTRNLRWTSSASRRARASIHPFGVDELGRDVLVPRHLRRSGLARGRVRRAPVSRHVFGVMLGLFAGFFRGWVDTLLSRIIDVVPGLPVAAACHRTGVGLLARRGLPRWACITSRDPVTLIFGDRARELDRTSRGSSAGRSCRCGRRSSSKRRVRSAHPTPDHASGRSCPTWRRRSSSTRLLIPTEHPVRGGAFLPRGRGPSRRRPAGAQMISDAAPISQPGLVVHGVPGARAPVDGARVQPRRRRPAGRAEPEGETLNVVPGRVATHPRVKQTRKVHAMQEVLLGASCSRLAGACTLGLAACGGE